MNATSDPETPGPDVPEEMLAGWRRLVTTIAEISGVPAGLITRTIGGDRIRMQVCSDQASNPYRPLQADELVEGMYCDRVIRGNGPLSVRDASFTGLSRNPDLDLGLVAYLGYPVSWSDGRPFGTICVLDDKPNRFGPDTRLLLSAARDAIEADLSAIDGSSEQPGGTDTGVEERAWRGRPQSLSWDLDVSSGTVRLSRVATRYFGLSSRRSTSSIDGWLSLFSPASRVGIEGMLAQLRSRAVDGPRTVHVVVGTGPNKGALASLNARGLNGADGRLSWVIGTQHDAGRITAARQTSRHKPTAVEATPRIVIDRSGVVVAVSADFPELWDTSPADLMGTRLDRIADAGSGGWPDLAASILVATREQVDEQLYRCQDRVDAPSHLLRIASQVVNGSLIGAEVVICRQADLATDHDLLEMTAGTTPAGLADRRGFEQQIDQLRIDLARTGREHAIVVFQIRGLEARADLDGQDFADWLVDLLGAAARRVATGHAVADLGFGRIGLAVWDRTPMEASAAATEAISEVQRELGQHGDASVAVSAGVVALADLAPTADELIRWAIATCDAAATSVTPVRVYDPHNTEVTRRHRRSRAAKDVRSALDTSSLLLYGQPIVPARHGSVPQPTHLEVLARMPDGRGGVLPAADFISPAEEFDLIEELDRSVLRRSIASLATQPASVRFSINLSAASLSRPGLWAQVDEMITAAGVQPHRLTFEITETALMAHREVAASFVRDARSFGCKVALDDFGTGMSSFAYLSQFEVDCLKIDAQFVATCTEPGPGRLIVESMNELAHRLGATSVAEGIETEEMLQAMIDIGVDDVQGYFVGPPSPLPVTT